MVSRQIRTNLLEIWKFRYMNFGICCSQITELDLKWVHMARYGLILKQDGAIWLRIISEPLPTQKGYARSKKKQNDPNFIIV